MPPRHRFLEPIHNVKEGPEPQFRGRGREDLVFIPGESWSRCSLALLGACGASKDGGASRDRTGDLKLAKLALSQLSYGPIRHVKLTKFTGAMAFCGGGPGRS